VVGSIHDEDSKKIIFMSKYRKDFFTEYEWLDFCAEHGLSDHQLWFASHIMTSRTDQNRVVEAYKWVFIAETLGNPYAVNVSGFLRTSMTEEQVAKADLLIDEWVAARDDDLLNNRTDYWSMDLKQKFRSAA